MLTTAQRIKKRRKKYKIRFASLIIIIALLALGRYVIHQPYMYYGILEVQNNKNVPKEDILHILQLTEPVNIFLLNYSGSSELLKQDLRIKDATVSFKFPNKVVVNITENKPVMCIVSKYAFFEVDYLGRVIKVSKSITNPECPLLTGTTAENLYVGDTINDTAIINSLYFISKLEPDFQKNISEINLQNNIIKVLTLNNMTIILGDYKGVPGKIEEFQIVFKQIQKEKIPIEYIDLTYSRPYIKIKEQ